MPDGDPVARSEDIDERVAILKSGQQPDWLLPALLVVMMLGGAVNLFVLHDVSETSRRLSDTNAEVLQTEIPGLKATIADRERVIADQRAVIDQAVAGLLRYAELIRELGGEPPPIVLQAPTTTTSAPAPQR